MLQNNQQDPWSKIFILERDLLENQKYLNKLDEKYPKYEKEYQAKYNSALDAIGGDTNGSKMLEYMK